MSSKKNRKKKRKHTNPNALYNKLVSTRPPCPKGTIEWMMRHLHYQKALDRLECTDPDERSPWQWLIMGTALSGLQRPHMALEALETALEKAPTAIFAVHVQLRLVRLYTQTGQLAQGEQRLEQADQLLSQSDSMLAGPGSALRDFYCLAAAWLHYEQGHPKQAMEDVQEVLDQPESLKRMYALCEAWTLSGDLCSVAGMDVSAIESYENALNCTATTPPNWRPLRRALITNNLADLYEGNEELNTADRSYRSALRLLGKVRDKQIVDLIPSSLEIILSAANNLIQFDDLDEDDDWSEPGSSSFSSRISSDHLFKPGHARNPLRDPDRLSLDDLITLAEELLERVPMPNRLYWRSRIEYIKGLALLYERKTSPALPFEHFLAAWRAESEFERLHPVSSSEYLGRIAYYAAYCYDLDEAKEMFKDDPDACPSEADLYKQALSAFETCRFKDPKFFDYTIASIHNELGTIALKEGDNIQALHQYDQAVQELSTFLKGWPYDEQARSSLCAILLNEIDASDQAGLEEHGEKILSALFDQLEELIEDWSNLDRIIDAQNRVIENDRLFPAFEDLIEKRIERLKPRLQETERQRQRDDLSWAFGIDLDYE